MPDFFKMPEKEIILLSAEVAILLADNLTSDQQSTLGNFLMAVGQDIILAAGQKAIREKYFENKNTGNEEKNQAKINQK
ncbi:MAG: hypothetical protein FWF92_05605 [Oscillospiraceae bacterium]|nr:hypothetical protein [Oscillospiraceae bacterium]